MLKCTVHISSMLCVCVSVFLWMQIGRFQAARVMMLRQALTLWCEKQLHTARESSTLYSQHLQAFRDMEE